MAGAFKFSCLIESAVSRDRQLQLVCNLVVHGEIAVHHLASKDHKDNN